MIGTSADTDFPWNSNADQHYATDFDINFTFDSLVDAEVLLTSILTIEKTIALPLANPGDEDIEYKVVVNNNGASDAINAVLTDVMPAGLTFDDGGGTIKTWNLGTIPAGENSGVIYLVDVAEEAAANDYINTAQAVADNHAAVSDTAELTIREGAVAGITVLAPTGFEPRQAGVLIIVLFSFGGAAYYLRRRYAL